MRAPRSRASTLSASPRTSGQPPSRSTRQAVQATSESRGRAPAAGRPFRARRRGARPFAARDPSSRRGRGVVAIDPRGPRIGLLELEGRSAAGTRAQDHLLPGMGRASRRFRPLGDAAPFAAILARGSEQASERAAGAARRLRKPRGRCRLGEDPADGRGDARAAATGADGLSHPDQRRAADRPRPRAPAVDRRRARSGSISKATAARTSFDGLDVSRTVGWFTTMFPVRLELPSRPRRQDRR